MFGRATAHLARPAQRRRRTFQFERLEERLAMAGDVPSAAGTLVAVDDSGVVATPPAASATNSGMTDDVLSTFQSTAEFEAWLLQAAAAEWSHLIGQPTYYPDPYGGFIVCDVAPAGPIVLRATANRRVAFDGTALAINANSETNVQVAGVDEADLVETDGEFLYIISGKELKIIRAGVGDELELLSRVQLEEEPVGMYLDGDRLAIVSSNERSEYFGGTSLRVFNSKLYGGYSSEPSKTTVTVLDISDRTAPALVQKTEMDGQFVASRVVDGELRLVLSNSLSFPPPIAHAVGSGEEFATGNLTQPQLFDLDDSYWQPPEAPYVYETHEEYLARVRDEILSTQLPELRILGLEGEILSSETLTGATDIYRSGQLTNRTLTTIATFDLSADEAGPAATKSVFTTGAPQVYATSESVYLFDEGTVNYLTDHYTGPNTSIHKFDFDAASHAVTYSAYGYVEGTLLNQFAADVHDGHLRVVTTPDWGTFGHKLSVLKQVGQRLEMVGDLGGLAPREFVYSVRFMGERAFLVTYQKVDPLFAIDLSDPTDPTVLGELKLPGYSDYLQPIDENHLFAIGRGADEATGLFQELQVSIFNIADMTDPQLLHRYSFAGGRAIATPATGDRWLLGDGDHHAVSYFAEAGVFALPIFNADQPAWWWNESVTEGPLQAGESGLQVFHIDVMTGFTPIGLIEHDSPIERSVQIGEHLYAISSGKVTVHELSDPTVQLGELALASDDVTLTPLGPYEVMPVITTIVAPAWPEINDPTVPEVPAASEVPTESVEISAIREVAPAERTATPASTAEVALPRVGEVPLFAVRSDATARQRLDLPRVPVATKAVDRGLLNLSISRQGWLRSDAPADDAFATLDFAADVDVSGELADDLAQAWAALPAAI